MRIKAKDAPAAEIGGAILDDAGRRIAVFDGRWKLALLKRTTHALPFALRHLPSKHERLGAPANGACTSADQQLARSQRAQPLGSDLAAARGRDPKRARL